MTLIKQYLACLPISRDTSEIVRDFIGNKYDKVFPKQTTLPDYWQIINSIVYE